MHSSFNLLFFPNSMFTQLQFFYMKGYVLSGEIALKNNHYYFYCLEEFHLTIKFFFASILHILLSLLLF